jgi:hypothetical protein
MKVQRLRSAARGPDPEMLADILAGARNRNAARSRPDGCGEPLKVRVAREIGPFLGGRAARILLQLVSEDGKDLLSTIEPVLAHFLGDQAASDLVNHVVDAAIVGT